MGAGAGQTPRGAEAPVAIRVRAEARWKRAYPGTTADRAFDSQHHHSPQDEVAIRKRGKINDFESIWQSATRLFKGHDRPALCGPSAAGPSATPG